MSDALPTRGFLTLGQIHGAALRVHFTTPLGAWVFAGFHFVAPVWLAFMAPVLVHEFGHALMVWRSGARVDRIDVLPFGGICAWRGELSPVQRACVAFAGVWAQLVAFAIAKPVVLLLAGSMTTPQRQFAEVFTTSNLWLVALNLLPFEPFDGAEAWRLVPLLVRGKWSGFRRARLRSRVDSLDARLKSAPPQPGNEKKSRDPTPPNDKTWLN